METVQNFENTVELSNMKNIQFEELEEMVAPSATKDFLTGFATGLGVVGGSIAIVGAMAT